MSRQTKLSRNVTGILKNLFQENKFKLSFKEHYAEHFGNEIIEYEFESFLMFVTKARDHLFIDLASKNSPDTHIPLPDVLEFIGTTKTAVLAGNDFQTIKRQLEVLSRNFNKIQEKLSSLNEPYKK